MNNLLVFAFVLTFLALAVAGSNQAGEESSKVIHLRETKHRKGDKKGVNKQIIKRKQKKSRKGDRKKMRKNKQRGQNKDEKNRKTQGSIKTRNQEKQKRRRNKNRRNKIHCRQSSSNLTCLDNAMQYLKLMKDNVGNYLRQDKRFRAANKTGGKKSGKKGLFGPVLQNILKAGGDNKSQLTCNGVADSPGAKKLTNLSNTLIKCESNINMSCNTDNFPLPNITKVESCLSTMTSFKSMVDTCMNLSESSACTCWSNSSFTPLVNIIKSVTF